MTILNSTPTVWLALQNTTAAMALLRRIGDFAVGHELGVITTNRSRMLHDVAQHRSGWLVTNLEGTSADELAKVAADCRAANPYFRCLVIGGGAGVNWPKDTLFVTAGTLSTTVLDRLRSETHALRLTSARERQLQRLKSRMNGLL
jgi:hypothetical protein